MGRLVAAYAELHVFLSVLVCARSVYSQLFDVIQMNENVNSMELYIKFIL